MLKRLVIAMLIIGLSGCGVAYISPQVNATANTVQVVALTAQNLPIANNAVYHPKTIPDAFFRPRSDATRAPGSGAVPSLPAQSRPAPQIARLPPVPVTGSYRIGVGDVIILATKSAGGTVQELTGLLAAQNRRQGYTVQDDGAIAVPDVGRIPLASLTLEEAETLLFQRLVQSGIDPSFSLEIAEFNAQEVTVGGRVANPVALPINLTPLFLDAALARAGGMTAADLQFATIRIYRDGVLYQIPVSQYLAQAGLQKTRLVGGDSIFVDTTFDLEKAQAYFREQITRAQFQQQARAAALAALDSEVARHRAERAERRANFQALVALDAVDRDHVYLTGEVIRPGRFALPFGRQATLADALFSENGISPETGNPSQVYLLRGNPGAYRITAWQLDARNVANLVLATQMELRPNDIIFVAEQPVTRWNRTVQQIVPSLITTGAGLAAE